MTHVVKYVLINSPLPHYTPLLHFSLFSLSRFPGKTKKRELNFRFFWEEDEGNAHDEDNGATFFNYLVSSSSYLIFFDFASLSKTGSFKFEEQKCKQF
ncbi:hypothetical protein QN277_015539 [Acacia crassicarpa]|uniref:Uncharacterized protein n=1 Tax=Acacia crassicarpa TaxID=499986 RepID=A0AAE1JVF7_9FABA|nr:hypothetical protein QN277_015539 [Acacia crassicarpa]